MDAVAHNVANVNTPGYSRQRVVLSQAASGSPNGVGGGVDVKSIERLRDRFVDVQTRTESGTAGDYRARATSLGFVEATLGQSGPGSLQDAMDQFFNAWRDLANAPEQSAVRAGVVQAGEAFAMTAERIARSLTVGTRSGEWQGPTGQPASNTDHQIGVADFLMPQIPARVRRQGHGEVWETYPGNFRDCSKDTGFIQPVHDGVMRGFVDGLRLGLHATYPAPSVH